VQDGVVVRDDNVADAPAVSVRGVRRRLEHLAQKGLALGEVKVRIEAELLFHVQVERGRARARVRHDERATVSAARPQREAALQDVARPKRRLGVFKLCRAIDSEPAVVLAGDLQRRQKRVA